MDTIAGANNTEVVVAASPSPRISISRPTSNASQQQIVPATPSPPSEPTLSMATLSSYTYPSLKTQKTASPAASVPPTRTRSHSSIQPTLYDRRSPPEPPANPRKRSADGEILEAQNRAHNAPSQRYRHTRTRSAVTSTSTTPIDELSMDLKTRLRYAMMKLSHGWQTHTIDEIESLTSHTSSPAPTNTSTSTSTPPPTTSTEMATASTASSQSSDMCRTPDLSQLSSYLPPPVPPSTTASSYKSSSHRRTQSQQGLARAYSLPSGFPSPPDVPSTPKTQITSSLARSNSYTAPRLRNDGLPQNIREQDAIETLLFLSSPGNNLHYQGNHSQNSNSSMEHNTPRGSISHPSNFSIYSMNSQPSYTTAIRPATTARKPLPASRSEAGTNRRRSTHQRSMSMGNHENNNVHYHHHHHHSNSTTGHGLVSRHLPLPLSLDHSMTTHRSRLSEDEIDLILENMGKAGNHSDDDDDEIRLPRSLPQYVGIGR